MALEIMVNIGAGNGLLPEPMLPEPMLPEPMLPEPLPEPMLIYYQ